MKILLFGIAIAAVAFVSCSNNNDQSIQGHGKDSDTTQMNIRVDDKEAKQPAILKEVISGYLNLKNALANDNAKEAATAGKEVADAIQKIDQGLLTEDQKKVYDDVKEDIKEHGEHISGNADKIAHQREHFEILSKDMYDLVKAVRSDQLLYLDHCPMYNNNNGADWISELKEIKNPYLGTKMPTCGSVKEAIK